MPATDTNVFATELDTLIRETGVKLEALVRLGQKIRPSVPVPSVSAISAWRHGHQVPHRDYHTFFLTMVDHLSRQPRTSGSTYVSRSGAWWREQLEGLRKEKDRQRGGRPPTVRSNSPSALVRLPARPVGFTGRREQLTQLLEQLEPSIEPERAKPALSTVTGMGGVGKTTLALEAAHQAVSRGWFPGGVLVAVLREDALGNHNDISAVLDPLLRELGVKDKDVPPDEAGKVSLWRALLHDLGAQQQAVLIILDNVLEPALPRELRPDLPHRMLLTSRQTLSTLPARSLQLTPFEPSEAVELLDVTLRAANPADDRVSLRLEDATELAALCGHLPLALHIVSALLRDEPDRLLAEQAAELVEARTRLDVLSYDEQQGRPLAVRAAFEVSYRRLPQEEARAFRLLSCTPGSDMSTEAAAALFDRNALSARRLLAALLRAHLLEKRLGERWAMHDLVRLFSLEQGSACADQDQRQAATERFFRYYLAVADTATAHLGSAATSTSADTSCRFASRADALAWLEQERSVLVAVAVTAASLGYRNISYLLSRSLTAGGFLYHRGYLDDLLLVARIAKAMALALKNPALLAEAIAHYAVSLQCKEDHAEALRELACAARIFLELGQSTDQARVITQRSFVLHDMGRYEEALDVARQAQRMLESLDDENLMTSAKHAEALALRSLGQLDNALDTLTTVDQSLRRSGDPHGAAASMNSRGIALRQQGKPREAVAAHRTAAQAMEQLGDRRGQGSVLNGMGLAYIDMEQFGEAIEALSHAHKLLSQIEAPVLAATAIYHRGIAHEKLRNWDEALQDFDLALAAFREADNLKIRIETTQFRRGMTLYGKAMSEFELGTFLADHGRPFEAVTAFEQAAINAQEGVAAFQELGHAKWTSAMAALREASERARHAASDTVSMDKAREDDGPAGAESPPRGLSSAPRPDEAS